VNRCPDLRRLSSLAFAALAAAGCARDEAGAETVLDRSRERFLEDERIAEPNERRSLAALEAELVGDGRTVELRLEVSAEGAEVDPVPGFAGIRGSNRVTARELTRIGDGGRLEVRTVPRDGGDPRAGSHAVARRGHVPERRLAPDGTVELAGETREEFVLELALRSGPLAPGRYTTEVSVDGRTRLAVDFSSEGRTGRIERWRLEPEPPELEELRP
jgi:hypothetical protein